MKYYHIAYRKHAEEGHPDEILKLGDIVSFGSESFSTKKNYITYYNPKTDTFDIPDEITLLASRYSGKRNVVYSKEFVGKEIAVDARILMPLSSKFMITGFTPRESSYNGGTTVIHTWTCMLLDVDYDRFVEFHFHSGYTTSIDGIFVHDPEDTYEDKMSLMGKIERAQKDWCMAIDEMLDSKNHYYIPMFPDYNVIHV